MKKRPLKSPDSELTVHNFISKAASLQQFPFASPTSGRKKTKKVKKTKSKSKSSLKTATFNTRNSSKAFPSATKIPSPFSATLDALIYDIPEMEDLCVHDSFELSPTDRQPVYSNIV
jgi:hypothetical protein